MAADELEIKQAMRGFGRVAVALPANQPGDYRNRLAGHFGNRL
ncbi:MAG: hypothetical protein JWO25_1150, partial [Alphaproteobacteria bacterium]|nr:hypothetical protein [Alphaproteobacteria bacterium]